MQPMEPGNSHKSSLLGQRMKEILNTYKSEYKNSI